MNRLLLLLLCFLPFLIADQIVDEDDADFDPNIFWCGVMDDFNVWHSRLVRVDPKPNMVIDSPWIVNIRRSVFQRCGETVTLKILNTKLNTLTRQRLEGLKNLEMLSFFNNVIDNITDGTFDELPHLTELDLSYNRLNGLDDGVRTGLKELKKLHLNQNPILLRKDGFGGLSKLELLELTGANITIIPSGSFDGLDHLQRLDLSSNNLTTILESSFRSLSQLEELDLSLNQISNISKETFEGLTNLKTLWLNDNKISSLETDDMFDFIPNLNDLFMHKNPLQFFDAVVFKQMQSVNIEPGFVLDSSVTVRKNFANVSSILYYCSRLYGRPALLYYDAESLPETSESPTTISIVTENSSPNYYKPYYCILLKTADVADPHVHQL